MARHRVVRNLPWTPEQLFELVGDVERYPDFVPWITSMRTWNRRDEDGVSILDAEATVGFSFLREKFATRVRRDPKTPKIEVSLLHGPFRRLANRWVFEADGQGGTKLTFDIDFAFKSTLLELTLASNFDRAVNKLMACFEARAAKLYGAKAVGPVVKAASGKG